VSITDSQLQEYKAIFASPLGPEQVAAIACSQADTSLDPKQKTKLSKHNHRFME
jgi:hypothetical protein